MTKFKEDYFIVQDEESCAFLFRKEDIEKYIQIENIKSAINGSDKHILINGYDQQTIFYFDFSPVNYEKQKYFSIIEEKENILNTIFTIKII